MAEAAGVYILPEPGVYKPNFEPKNDALRLENTVSWDDNVEATTTWRGPTRPPEPAPDSAQQLEDEGMHGTNQ